MVKMKRIRKSANGAVENGNVCNCDRNYGIINATKEPIRKPHSMLISSSFRGNFMSTSETESPDAIIHLASTEAFAAKGQLGVFNRAGNVNIYD